MTDMNVSWRDYVDTRFEAIKEAITKAESANDKRFDGVNEFRGQLGDQTRLLMPRLEVEEKFKGMEKSISELTTRVNAREDRGRGMGEIWGYVLGVLGALAIIYSFLRK
jgi:hypothetical protein